MADWIVYGALIVCAVPVFVMMSGLIEYAWWELKEKMGWEVECDCRTPQDYSPLGSTYICEDCARKWYSTHDNVCWAGWARAPWWKRAQMNLGWELKGRRKEADPLLPPVTEKPKGPASLYLRTLVDSWRRTL